jgi:hypothetical protein
VSALAVRFIAYEGQLVPQVHRPREGADAVQHVCGHVKPRGFRERHLIVRDLWPRVESSVGAPVPGVMIRTGTAAAATAAPRLPVVMVAVFRVPMRRRPVLRTAVLSVRARRRLTGLVRLDLVFHNILLWRGSGAEAVAELNRMSLDPQRWAVAR